MALSDSAALSARARRAYEWGRVRHAAMRAGWLAPVFLLALLGCRAPVQSLFWGAALVLLVAACLWRGQDYALGVWPGVVAGAFPLLIPMLLRVTHTACSGGRCYTIPTCCVLGGLAAGLVLGLLAPTPRPGRLTPFITACAVAAVAGAAGCVLYGFVGATIMVAGLVAAALPVAAVVAPLRTR